MTVVRGLPERGLEIPDGLQVKLDKESSHVTIELGDELFTIKGNLVNLSRTATAIKRAIDEAEKNGNIDLQSVYAVAVPAQ